MDTFKHEVRMANRSIETIKCNMKNDISEDEKINSDKI